MSRIEIKELTPNDYAQWDALVDRSPQGTLFHKSFWVETASRVLKKRVKFYGCFEKGRLIAGCSLFFLRSRTNLYNRAESTGVPAMTPYGGLIIDDLHTLHVRKWFETANEIINELTHTLVKQGVQTALLLNSPAFTDVRPFWLNGWIASLRYTYYLDLTGNYEERFSPSIRRGVKEAMEQGVKISKQITPTAYYNMFAMTFERQKSQPPVPAEYFEQILEKLTSLQAGEVWVAETSNGGAASAEIFVWDAKRAYRWSAASHTDHQKTSSTTLLLCQIFKNLKERGIKQVDLMAATMPALSMYVGGFNPALVPYYPVARTTTLARVADSAFSTVNRLIGMTT